MMTLQGRLRSCFNDICIEAADRIDDLERQLANALVRDIHSCHPDCDRVGCVNARLRREVEALRADAERYRELVMLVGNKHPDESRHDTARRYLINAEKIDSTVAIDAARSKT